MSLRRFIRDYPEVRSKFNQEFPTPSFLSTEKQIIAENLTNRADLIGTAADYLIRFYVEWLNKEKTIKGEWVASSAVSSFPEPKKKLAKLLLKKAKKNYKAYLNTGEATDALYESCIWLAQMDFFYRESTDLLEEAVLQSYKDDLKKIFAVLKPSGFTTKKTCILNPTFGKGSILVGGADADLIIDDALIEIKTTINPRRTDRLKETYYQLLGYYVLSEIGGVTCINKIPKVKIDKIGVYYSRQGVLVTKQLRELINPKTFPAFKKWFITTAKEIF